MHHHNPAEALSAHDAISLYTSAAARVSHDEQRLGKLLPGYDADFVVLDKPISKESPTTVQNILAVYKSGAIREVS
jgi:predicted amidohydrolase YtcJ